MKEMCKFCGRPLLDKAYYCECSGAANIDQIVSMHVTNITNELSNLRTKKYYSVADDIEYRVMKCFSPTEWSAWMLHRRKNGKSTAFD